MPRRPSTRLTTSLSAVALRRPDLREPLDAAMRSLGRLAGAQPRAGRDRGVAGTTRSQSSQRRCHEALPADERAALDAGIEKQLSTLRDRMDEETARRTGRALTRRMLRERLDLPRLTLL